MTISVTFVWTLFRVVASDKASERPRPDHVGQHGNGAADPDREQAARCLHPARGAHATRPAADRRGGRSVGREELGAGELRRQVMPCVPRPPHLPTPDPPVLRSSSPLSLTVNVSFG